MKLKYVNTGHAWEQFLFCSLLYFMDLSRDLQLMISKSNSYIRHISVLLTKCVIIGVIHLEQEVVKKLASCALESSKILELFT